MEVRSSIVTSCQYTAYGTLTTSLCAHQHRQQAELLEVSECGRDITNGTFAFRESLLTHVGKIFSGSALHKKSDQSANGVIQSANGVIQSANGRIQSANGAQYDSQGQARSASPLGNK